MVTEKDSNLWWKVAAHVVENNARTCCAARPYLLVETTQRKVVVVRASMSPPRFLFPFYHRCPSKTTTSTLRWSTQKQPMWLKQRQLFVDPSYVFVDVRAILWPVIAVRTPKTSLVEVAMGPVVTHHTVFRQETVCATRAVEPTVMICRLSTCKHGFHINIQIFRHTINDSKDIKFSLLLSLSLSLSLSPSLSPPHPCSRAIRFISTPRNSISLDY